MCFTYYLPLESTITQGIVFSLDFLRAGTTNKKLLTVKKKKKSEYAQIILAIRTKAAVHSVLLGAGWVQGPLRLTGVQRDRRKQT